MKSNENRTELKWVLGWALAIVLLASVPYIHGAAITPAGYHFVGLTQNVEDGAVYLSWTRQAADGHFYIRNLFTNDPQPKAAFNLLFLVMGCVARLTHLSCIAVYHLFRVLLGIGLLFAVYRFSMLFVSDRRARLLLIPLVGLSSGIGWLIPNVQFPTGSVDVWQPEAITFLSIYLNPLFLAGLLLMLGSLYYLILMERTGRARYAVFAGLLVLLLGNIHSYDVLTVGCVWLAYTACRAIIDRKPRWRAMALSLLAAIIALPSLAYQFHVYQIDAVYRERANTAVASPPITSFLTGFGLVLIAAIVGAAILFAEYKKTSRDDDAPRYPFLLPVVWSVVGFAIPYIPIAQQRKLIMGLHIPLCILAAVAIARLGARWKPIFSAGLLCALMLALFQTNSKFLQTDIGLLSEGKTVTITVPYLTTDQLKAMDYVGAHASPDQSTLANPQFAIFLPGYADRPVYCGHWSETPEYRRKLNMFLSLVSPVVPIPTKRSILLETGSDYAVFESSWELNGLGDPSKLGLVECAHFGDVHVFRTPKR